MEILLTVIAVIVTVWIIRIIVRNGGEEAINQIAQALATKAESWAKSSYVASVKNDARLNDELSKDGDTALMLAYCVNDNPAIITTLIEHGADVNARTKNGFTALMMASWFNDNPAIITTLIDHGADVNAQTKKGYTALMLASDNKNPAIAKILIEHGAK